MINPDSAADIESAESCRKGLYRVAGIATIIAVIITITEAGITFLPVASQQTETVLDWFILLQDNWFIGLRNLGLLNLIFIPLGIPIYLALYCAHRKTNKAHIALIAMIVSFIGITVFLATNRALPMLELSNQYSIATTDTQRSILIAAGQSMLYVGKSHVPGTFIGFLFGEVAGIIMSAVMLQGRIFSRTNAFMGIFGFTFLLINEIFLTFIPQLFNTVMLFGMVGGLITIIWYIMVSRRFFRLEHIEEN